MLYSNIQKLSISPIIQLFTISGYDKANLAASFKFTNEPIDIVWKTLTYTSIPIEVSGFEFKAKGTLPRPTMRISNVGNVITSIVAQYDDLIGAKVTRVRTLAKYLDGQPTADPSFEFLPDIYYVEQKTSEVSGGEQPIVEWSLVSSLDLDGIQIPRRRIITSTCLWQYRGPDCGYTGGAVADVNDNPTSNIASDQCGKRLRSCKLRFDPSGTGQPLPTSAFPGATRYE